MVTKRCRQRNLHEMSYTIKYRVKTKMATGVAVSTERVIKVVNEIYNKHIHMIVPLLHLSSADRKILCN